MICAKCGLRAFCAKGISQLMSDDECCLQHIWDLRYGDIRTCPRCKKFATYHRCQKKKCWQCAQCAHQLSPLASTIFHKSTTPLSTWFSAISIMHEREPTITELQRELNCTYKTAWRMFWRIHTLFSNNSLQEYLHSVGQGAHERVRDTIHELQSIGHSG